MRVLRRIFSRFYVYILWFFFAFLAVGLLFGRLNDSGGSIAITVNDCAIRYSRVLRAHEERILASEEETRELRGLVTLDKKRVRIARSIDVRGVRVQTAEGAVRLLINEAFSEELARAAAQGELTLRSVEGYVTEVER